MHCSAVHCSIVLISLVSDTIEPYGIACITLLCCIVLHHTFLSSSPNSFSHSFILLPPLSSHLNSPLYFFYFIFSHLSSLDLFSSLLSSHLFSVLYSHLFSSNHFSSLLFITLHSSSPLPSLLTSLLPFSCQVQRYVRCGSDGLIVCSSTRLEDVPSADFFSVEDTISVRTSLLPILLLSCVVLCCVVLYCVV